MGTGTTAENTKNETLLFHIELNQLHLQVTFSVSGVTVARFTVSH